jgi:hypothetical protein
MQLLPIFIAAGGLVSLVSAAGPPASADDAGAKSQPCRIIHRHESNGGEQASGTAEAPGLQSSVTIGNGTASARTTTGSSARSTSSAAASGTGVTIHSGGDGSASAAASSSNGETVAAGSAGGDCVIVTD